MTTDKITAEAVREAIEGISRAKAEARDVCRQYAQDATGWKKGDRIKRKRRDGETVQVVRFQGTHPHKWNESPVVKCLRVKRDGTVGKREVYITIDPEDSWTYKWEKLEADDG